MLLDAIAHAHRVLSWMENLTEDEMPEEWRWPLDWEIEKWSDELKAIRAEKYGGAPKGNSDFNMTGPDWDENEYAAQFRAQAGRQIISGCGFKGRRVWLVTRISYLNMLQTLI